jgi:hypothetical protein
VKSRAYLRNGSRFKSDCRFFMAVLRRTVSAMTEPVHEFFTNLRMQSRLFEYSWFHSWMVTFPFPQIRSLICPKGCCARGRPGWGHKISPRETRGVGQMPPPASPISKCRNGGGMQQSPECDKLFSSQTLLPLPPNPFFDLGEGRDGGTETPRGWVGERELRSIHRRNHKPAPSKQEKFIF